MMPIDIIKKNLRSTRLGEEKQEEFASFLSSVPSNYLRDIAEMSAEDEHFLEFLYENYKKKEMAFLNNDKTLADEILEEEKDYLSKKTS